MVNISNGCLVMLLRMVDIICLIKGLSNYTIFFNLENAILKSFSKIGNCKIKVSSK